MNGMLNRLGQLEARFERLLTIIADIQGQLANAVGNVRALQMSGGGSSSGGGGFVYFLNPIVIAPGGNVTGQTVYTNIGGTQTATSFTSATVYNEMASATTATSGKIIIVGPNPDGTWSVITQSC